MQTLMTVNKNGLGLYWHERSAFLSVGVQAVDWQRR